MESRKILLTTLSAIIILQLVRPVKNINLVVLSTDISFHSPFPDTVKCILQRSCYNCHSNNTVYPWYAEIEPIGWLINFHIVRGKSQLNFSEFYALPKRRQFSKLASIANQLKSDNMPLSSYVFGHPCAKLSEIQKSQILNWISQLSESIKLK
jgi:hypothetical protein